MTFVAEVPHRRGYGGLFKSHISRGEGSDEFVPRWKTVVISMSHSEELTGDFVFLDPPK